MTAGLVAMSHLEEARQQALNELGDDLRQRLRSLVAERDLDAQVVGAGSLFACTSTAVHCDGSTTFVGTAEERRKTRFMQNFPAERRHVDVRPWHCRLSLHGKHPGARRSPMRRGVRWTAGGRLQRLIADMLPMHTDRKLATTRLIARTLREVRTAACALAEPS